MIDSVDFGFKRVDADEKTSRVQDVFDQVAARYDLMNDLMSGGLHRLWKDKFVSLIRFQPNQHYLDGAGGTGDIALRIWHHLQYHDLGGIITVFDLNAAMLEAGRTVALDRGICDQLQWVQSNAESLPFKGNSQDIYTMTFGLRNVTHRAKALRDAYRVLKSGGQFLCMEFGPVDNPFLKPLYNFYSLRIIPKIGKYVARDEAAYQYFVESIQQFPKPEVLKAMILDAGFQHVTYKKLSLGIVTIYMGWKP